MRLLATVVLDLCATNAKAQEAHSATSPSAGPSNVGSDGMDSEETEDLHAANAVLFLFVGLAFGLLFRRAMAGFIIPYSGLLVIWGLVLGLADQRAGWEHMGQGIELWTNMDPTLFLLTFLPILLFGSGSTLDWHTFFRNAAQVLILAFPMVGIQTCIIAPIFKYVFPYSWSWTESFLFGSIVSATDPVAVVAIMKEVGASKRLGHLIEGESLLNDGSAYVLFLIFFDMYAGTQRTNAEIVGYFCKLVFAASAFGVLFGILLTVFLALVYRDTVLEVSATIATAFLCFWVAEEIGSVSGVLAVVVLSIFMAAIGKYAVSPSVMHGLHTVWDVLEFIANTVVFFYFGVVVATRIWDGHRPSEGEQLLYPSDWGWGVLAYLLLNVIRFGCLALMKPLLDRVGDKFSWRDVIVATWAGLRGAVGLSLALIIDLKASQQPADAAQPIAPRFATLTVFFVGVVSVLTILIQGSSMAWLLSVLGITRKTPLQLQHLLMAAREVEEYADRNLSHLKDDYALGEPDWPTVIDATALDLGQLLPSRHEVTSLLARSSSSGFDKEAEELLKASGSGKKGLGREGGSAHNADTLNGAKLRAGSDESGGVAGNPQKIAEVAALAEGGSEDLEGLHDQTAKERAAAQKQAQLERDARVHDVVNSADTLLKLFQERRGKEISSASLLADIRSRYLQAVQAVFAEGFEKGYLSGEQHAALHSIIANALDGTDEPMHDDALLERHVRVPAYVRGLVRLLYAAGKLIPFARGWGDRVLFWNMEGDITMVAAYLFAHDQAQKGMMQLLSILDESIAESIAESDEGGEDGAEDPQIKQGSLVPLPQAEKDAAMGKDKESEFQLEQYELVEQVITEGRGCREAAAKLLAGYRRDYPQLVRAVKTRETAQTVLMHKRRFVASLQKAGLLEEKEANNLEELIDQRAKRLYFQALEKELPSKEQTLQEHPLFSHMSEHDLQRVMEAGSTTVFPSGAAIFRAGEPPARSYIVLRGTVSRMLEDGTTLHVSGTGTAIGITEVLLDIPRKYGAAADATVVTFSLPAKDFRMICERNEEFRLRAYQLAAATVTFVMQFPFSRGMSYPELLRAFKASEFLPRAPAGTSAMLVEPALLMQGTVKGAVPKPVRHRLARKGNTSQLVRSSVPTLPPASKRGAGEPESSRASAVPFEEVHAPAFLQAGRYPVIQDALLLTIPSGDVHAPLAPHHDHVRQLTLFRHKDLTRMSPAGVGLGRHESIDTPPRRAGSGLLTSQSEPTAPGARRRLSAPQQRSMPRAHLERTSMPKMASFISSPGRSRRSVHTECLEDEAEEEPVGDDNGPSASSPTPWSAHRGQAVAAAGDVPVWPLNTVVEADRTREWTPESLGKANRKDL